LSIFIIIISLLKKSFYKSFCSYLPYTKYNNRVTRFYENSFKFLFITEACIPRLKFKKLYFLEFIAKGEVEAKINQVKNYLERMKKELARQITNNFSMNQELLKFQEEKNLCDRNLISADSNDWHGRVVQLEKDLNLKTEENNVLRKKNLDLIGRNAVLLELVTELKAKCYTVVLAKLERYYYASFIKATMIS